MKPLNLWQEFKSFALKGSLIDLAIAVVIGQAFTNVVNSLAKNVIMPLIGYFAPSPDTYRSWKIGHVEIGLFLGELINFFIVALILWIVVIKLLGSIQKTAQPTSDEPSTRECPLCLSIIPFRAKKCAHCTADLVPAA
jgi:large conductance mechanosensitive channel